MISKANSIGHNNHAHPPKGSIMARNDIVLIDSLVKKSKSQIGNNREDSEVFELFVLNEMLKDYDPSFDELESGWTDGGNDGGIDGFFVYVDGRMATSDSHRYALRKNPQIDVQIFTIRRSPTFEQQPIDSLISSLGELLDLSKSNRMLRYPYNKSVIRQREIFSNIYVALADRQPKLDIQIHYCSRGETCIIAKNIQSRATILRELLYELFSNIEVKVLFQGASELLSYARKQRDFTLRLPYIENYVSREGRNYILLCTLSSYFKFITDENIKLRRYLFESNVRDYLGKVSINLDISQSLASQENATDCDFWWLNNGITILGTSASVAGKEICIENVQIVNGLQTTETIYRHFTNSKFHDDNRAILIKVILAADDDTRARIIKATNYQNSVDLSALRGLDKIQRDIETYLSDHGWFYDRRKNFYKNEGRPAERIISIPYLASAVRAIVLGDPISKKSRSRQLRNDINYNQAFNDAWDLRVYLASIQIIRTIESVLYKSREIGDPPPIALLHFIGYIYVCECLNKTQYSPDEVAELAERTPTEEDILRIRDELQFASVKSNVKARTYGRIKTNKALVNLLLKSKFPTK